MIEKILELKKQKKALIIAHYYMDGAIQDIADYVGDSFGMAKFAQDADYELAVVCGVKFMGETFKVMNPQKRILMPDLNAGCSLADTCTPEIFSYFKNKYPDHYVVTYINSSLAIKAMSDVIVTSANALKIINTIPKDKKILFAPDQNLGHYLSKKSGREMVFFPGNCFVHTSFSSQEMLRIKDTYPDAKIIAHPECPESVLNYADFIGSTSKLLEYTQNDASDTFIVMTESGILHQMKKLSPHKTFYAGPDMSGCGCNDCPHMKLNTLEKLYLCLKNESPEIQIDENVAKQALKSIDQMMAWS